MAYTTNCTCDAHQLELIGCDCSNNGPTRTIKTFEELREEADDAFYTAEYERHEAEIAYHENKLAEYEAGLMSWGNAREDFAEYTIEAANHQ